MVTESTLKYIKQNHNLSDSQYKDLLFVSENADRVQGELVKISASAAILTISQNLAEEVFFGRMNNSCEQIESSKITSAKLKDFFDALNQIRIRRSTDEKITEDKINSYLSEFSKKDYINKDDIDKFVLNLYNDNVIMGITNRIDPKAIEDHHKSTNIIRTNYDDIQTTIDLLIDEAKKKDSPFLFELRDLKANFSLHRENLADFPVISNALKQEMPEIRIALKEHEVVENPIVQYINSICQRHHQYNFSRGLNNSENADELVLLDNHSKSIYRILDKAFKEKNGDFSQITDASRASLVYDDAFTLDRALKNLLFVAEKKGHKINEINELVVKSGTFHVKYLIGIKLDDEKFFNCELQFIDQAQKQADKYTHQIYSLIRGVTGEGRSLDLEVAKSNIPAYAEKLDNIIATLKNPNDKFLKKIRNIKLGNDTLEKIADGLEKINMNKTYKELGFEKIEVIGDAEKAFLERSFELLNKAHLFIICATLKSRNSTEVEGEGLSDPSVSALYRKVTGDLNYKNMASLNKQIPESYLPISEIDFDPSDFSFAEKVMSRVRDVANNIKEVMQR